jgi:hypothetical protein
METDPFKTDDAAHPAEFATRRFAYGVMRALKNANVIDAGTHVLVRMPGGFELRKKETEMAFEIRENSGSLFANEDRLTDSSPNASGRCRIGGKLYRISSWTKTSGSGARFMSLAFQLDAKQELEDAEKIDAELPF